MTPHLSLQGDLPFRVFAWTTRLLGELEVDAVDVFGQRLETPDWASHPAFRDALQDAHTRYGDLWSQFRQGRLAADRDALTEALSSALAAVPADGHAALLQDVQRLAGDIARGPQRLFGRKRHHTPATVAQELVPLLGAAQAAAATPAAPRSARTLTGVRIAVPELTPPVVESGPPVWTRGPIRVRCVQVVDETHDVRTFRFAGAEPTRFSYLPGQSATLELSIEGERVLRTYTISSSPTRPDLLTITVKRVPGGLVSNWLHDNMHPGFELTIRGPNGKFTIAHHTTTKALFLSGGSGVTPLLSMTRWVVDQGRDVDIVFWHGSRALRDRICHDELVVYERMLPRFRTVYCLSNPIPDENWEGMVGHLSLEKLQASVPDFLERVVYLCGPVPFMGAAKDLLERAGYPMENFHQESFGGAPPKPSGPGRQPQATQNLAALIPRPEGPARPTASAPPPNSGSRPERSPRATSPTPAAQTGAQVTLKQSGLTFRVAPDQSILDAAEAAGAQLASSCRGGTCGTCKVKCLQGAVQMDETAGLSEADAEAGLVLVCVGRASADVILDA